LASDGLIVINSNGGLVGTSTELALTGFTQMILFAMAGTAIFLEPGGSTSGACLSDNHSGCWSPEGAMMVSTNSSTASLCQHYRDLQVV
jgi:hypothetical protein